MSTGTLWGSLFFIEKCFCSTLYFSENKRAFLVLRQTFWTWLSKLSSTCPQGHFEGLFFEQKLLSLLIMFGHWAKVLRPHGKIFSAFWRIFSRGLSELHSRCPGKYFEGKFLLNFFNAFRHWAKNFQAFVKTIFGGVCQNCIVKVQSFILSKKILEGFTIVSINFGFWAKNTFGFSAKCIWTGLLLLHFTCPQRQVEENRFFFKTLFFWSFFGDREKIFQASDSFSKHGCRNCSQLAHENF